ncbi:MAG: SIS domain-containing protein [Candidatus Marinimicrobia bacterium]|nr:SIS domain-containing protein [Candidatus Neomarinimicrobiota bacterium]
MQNFFKDYFSLMNSTIRAIDSYELKEVANLIRSVNTDEKKIILCGNGGSAAMASHVSVDLTKAARIKAINFNEADLLTCFANDYGFNHVFEKAVEFYGNEGDLLILISSSGQSKNVIAAAKKAKELGISVVTLTGFKSNNPLKQLGEINLWANSNAYNIVEMTHHIWLLSIVDFLVGDIYYSAIN